MGSLCASLLAAAVGVAVDDTGGGAVDVAVALLRCAVALLLLRWALALLRSRSVNSASALCESEATTTLRSLGW